MVMLMITCCGGTDTNVWAFSPAPCRCRAVRMHAGSKSEPDSMSCQAASLAYVFNAVITLDLVLQPKCFQLGAAYCLRVWQVLFCVQGHG